MAFGSGPPPFRSGRGGGEGVRTRDHLANARTFLALTRAGLALITVGYAIDKFDLIVHVLQHRSVTVGHAADHAIGLLVLAIGILVAIGACVRFLLARRMIEQQDFRPRPAMDLVLIAAAAIGGLVILGYLAKVGE